ncbi:fibronectin type III domain-containing protein [Geodermatophilus sp. URMC 64]
MSVLFAPSASAALSSFGPIDPVSKFPTYYTDANGLSLQMCQDGPPLCLSGPELIQDVNAAGGDAEAFYWAADADVGPITVHNALEAAYAGAGPDQEAVFMRTQIAAQDGGLTPGVTYKVTDPYGPLTCTADANGEMRNNSCRTETDVVGGEFQRPLSGRIGPFLTWDTMGTTGAGAPPAGYIGDGDTTLHKVKGSPTGFNKVRIEGPGINSGTTDACPDVPGPIADCAETDLFNVWGKVQDTSALASIVQTPAGNSTNVTTATNVTATYRTDVQGVSGSTFTLKDPAGATIPATVTYDAATHVATLDPTANLAASTKYTAALTGIRDAAGPVADVSWSFTTAAAFNGAGLKSFGPIDPTTLFPAYYTDAKALSLQLCQDGPDLCLAGPESIEAVNASGADAEAFYYAADADVGAVTVHNALEAAYAGAGPGQEAVFMRTQIAAQDGGLTPGAEYKVTDPYGPLSCTADANGEMRNNSCRTETTVVGGDFQRALPGRIAPFLTWDTYGSATGAPPVGYIGDNVTPHKVTGSPTGFNKVRIEGPGINSGTTDACPDVPGDIANCAETDLFVVQGKVAQDTTAPTVTAKTPADTATNVAVATDVTATFSEGVDGVSATTFTLKDAAGATIPGTVTRTGTSNQWVLKPNANLAFSTSYTATLTGGAQAIRDAANNPLTTVTWNFTTVAAPDTTAPTVTGQAPSANATGVGSTSNVTATFSEDVQGVDGTTYTLRAAGSTTDVPATVSYNAATKVAMLDPTADLAFSTSYTATLTGGAQAIRDAANNPLTTVTWSFTTAPPPATAPAAPAAPTATAGNASATVNWTAPANGGAAITGYTVRTYNAATGALVGTPLTVGNVTTANVTGLTNGTGYQFTVAAINSVGTSAESVKSTAVTPAAPATAPAAPAAPTATAGNASATVNWTAPANGGAAITGYTVRTYNAATGALVGTPLTVGNVTTANVTGLTNGTGYQFTVAAINSVGTSAESVKSTAVTPAAPATAPAAPAAPTATAGNASATVAWAAPANNGSPITGYTVRAYAGAATTAAITAPAAATATSLNLTGLTNGTSYTFTVTATNSVGTSPESPKSNAVTPAAATTSTAPATPAAPTATAGNTTATVNWTAPANGGSAITGYTLRVFTGTTQVGADRVLGNVTTTTVTGLTNGTAYTFRVAATNAIGTSAFSAASTAVTPTAPPPTSTAPATPAAPTATAGNTAATVSWTAPANGGSAITGYTLRVFTGTTQVGADRVLGNVTTTTVTGLTNGTAYTFRVAATNAIGTSAFSAASTAVTPTADTTAPTVTARTPLANATGVSRTANVTVTFSEAVQGVSTTTFLLRTPTGTNVAATVTRNGTTNEWILDPSVTLTANTRYTVALAGGPNAIRDLANNPLTTVGYVFTTGAV